MIQKLRFLFRKIFKVYYVSHSLSFEHNRYDIHWENYVL